MLKTTKRLFPIALSCLPASETGWINIEESFKVYLGLSVVSALHQEPRDLKAQSKFQLVIARVWNKENWSSFSILKNTRHSIKRLKNWNFCGILRYRKFDNFYEISIEKKFILRVKIIKIARFFRGSKKVEFLYPQMSKFWQFSQDFDKRNFFVLRFRKK